MEGVGQVALVGKDKGRDLMRYPNSYKACEETRFSSLSDVYLGNLKGNRLASDLSGAYDSVRRQRAAVRRARWTLGRNSHLPFKNCPVFKTDARTDGSRSCEFSLSRIVLSAGRLVELTVPPLLLTSQTSIPSAADLSFSLGRYHLAAQQYASQTSPAASLEEVVLKFVDVDEKDALRFYLGARFEQTAKTVRSSYESGRGFSIQDHRTAAADVN